MSTDSKTRFGIKNFEKKFGRLTFGKVLEAYRTADEISLKDMAKKLGISSSSLCDLEKGRRIPSPSRAYEIAKIAGGPPKSWVRLALQDQLDQEGLKFIVSIA
ncbi:MAG: helix-turn-helix transcriptional regulator [Rhizobacter sp.]|nr:helix-turn-helix transcriptional regulator [Bacteriovorax sp.]